MSNDNGRWDLDVLGRQVGPHKNEILDLESRVDWSERFVSQHERDIKQTRFEAAHIAKELENRIREQGELINGHRRLIGFLADVLFALIAALFGCLVSAYVQGDAYWRAGSGLVVFLTTLLAGNFIFKALTTRLHTNRKSKHDELGIRTTRKAKEGREAKTAGCEDPARLDSFQQS